MKRFVLSILLALSCQAFAAEPLTPQAAYRLTFEAEGAASRYAIHLRDANGNLPFDGALENDWQTLAPEKKTYTHLFYAPANATSFELRTPQNSGVTLSNVQLEKYEPENLFLNGEFSVGNHSGWSETYNATLTNNTLHIGQNGYALTDYTPIKGGGRYNVQGKQSGYGPLVLVYDSLRHFIGIIERNSGALFEVPGNAAWLRALYATSHSHIPALRENTIEKADLVPMEGFGVVPSLPEISADWEIVLAPGSDPREEHAARELQRWMTAITGKAPTLFAEATAGKTPKIFVGRAWADSFAEDLKALDGSDGYAVRTKDGNIYVFGARPRGTFYGVHELLERNTDIIWPRPNPEFAVIFSKTPTITFKDANFISRPVFSYRHVSRGGYTLKNSHIFQDWMGRNGLNSPWPLHTGNNYLVWQRGAQLGYAGSYMFWLRDVKDQDEKVLPLIDGVRVDNVWRQPCYSYKGTSEGIAAQMRKLLQTLPGREMEYLHATIADNWTVCGCPDCLAPIILPDGKKLTTDSTDATKNPLFFSTRNFMMLNKVAEDVVKDYPDIQITTHAYIFPAEPPAVPVHSSIVPEFAAYPTQNVRYPILSGEGKGQVIGSYTKDLWKRRFEQWGKLKKGKLGYFGYYYVEGFNALADSAAEDFRALARFDAVMAHTEGFPVDDDELSSWDADAIEKWVMAKLMWDPSQDPEKLREQYISRVYHGAEKEMTAFYKLIRDAWHNAPEKVFVNCHTPAKDIFQDLIITPGIEEQAKKLLADAEKATNHPQAKKLIQRHRAWFQKLSDTLGRVAVPYVEESKNEWLELSSPHWEKAAVVEGFRKVDDWRSFEKAATKHPTKVRVMHDRENLYIRFDGADENLAAQVKPSEPAGQIFPNGDGFEVRLQTAGKRDYYLAVGPGGHYYSQPTIGNRLKTVVAQEDKSWTAILAVPLHILGTKEEERAGVKARFGRLYRLQGEDSEESSHNGAGLFNEHLSLWLDLQIK